MHSVLLADALTNLAGEAADRLHAEVLAGAEVPFELGSRSGTRGSAGPALYCYRALTGEFIAARRSALQRLPGYGEAERALQAHDGLDRYLAVAGVEPSRGEGSRADAAIGAFLRDVFAEQTDFELRPERLRDALRRLEQASLAGAAGVTMVATLHGLTIVSPQLALTSGLQIARPEALQGLPEGAISGGEHASGDHLVAVFATDEVDARSAQAHGRAVLLDLLRALRLFGDGRVTLGSLAWSRVDGGGWSALALGSGGRPHGMLLVTAEQEDELRAFCNLVSRRAPHGDEVAWALRRFELGCERDSAYEALTDNLLALRALLEPEGPASGLLPGRLAALCATPENRGALTGRIVAALELERSVLAGRAVVHAGGEALARDTADHLRALLRDVICGHLDVNLAALADEILLEAAPACAVQTPAVASGQEVPGDLGEPEEILDLFV